MHAISKDPTKARQKFLHTLFHELKVPVSSVNGYLSLLISGDLGKLSRTQLKVIHKTHELSLYITQIINNISSMSRLGKQRVLHYERIDLEDLIRKTISALDTQIKNRKIKIITRVKGITEPIWLSPVDMEQIMINILSNAVKFTPKSGTIDISAFKKANKLCLDFKDTGIGIPRSSLDKIFKEFYRADNAARDYDGCGLGLSIVKKLLKAHKGRISIDSKTGRGTTVKVILPLLTGKDVLEAEKGVL